MVGLWYKPAFEDDWKEVDTTGCLEDGVEDGRVALVRSSLFGSLVSLEMVVLVGEVVMFVLRAVDEVLAFFWRER